MPGFDIPPYHLLACTSRGWSELQEAGVTRACHGNSPMAPRSAWYRANDTYRLDDCRVCGHSLSRSCQTPKRTVYCNWSKPSGCEQTEKSRAVLGHLPLENTLGPHWSSHPAGCWPVVREQSKGLYHVQIIWGQQGAHKQVTHC